MTTAPLNNETVLVSHIPSETKKRSRRGKNAKKQQNCDSQSLASNDTGSSSSTSQSPQRRRRRRNQPNKADVNVPQEEKDQFVAMDCEMVGVGYQGRRSALARVCVINWNGKKLMDSFVLPNEPVTDYRTFVSGITPEDLDSEKVISLEECRERVQALLEGKILVGHALKNDLHVLNISHPWFATRDTGKYEPFMKQRFDDGVYWPRKLKELAKEKMGRDIQQEGAAHSAFVDAKTAMDLYKLVRNKWEKAMAYKIKKTFEIQKLNETTYVTEEPKLELAQ